MGLLMIFLPLFLLPPLLLTTPTSASPLSHKHPRSRPTANHLTSRDYIVVAVGGNNRRDLEGLEDRSEGPVDPEFPDFPEFPEFPEFPDLLLPDFPGLEELTDPSILIPAPEPAPPASAPASADKFSGSCGEAQAHITITQIQVTTETTTKTTIETATVTIDKSNDDNDNFLDKLFGDSGGVKKEPITIIVTTTETEFAPGQTVTVTAEEVQGDIKAPVITMTVTENPQSVTVTETEIQIQTIAAELGVAGCESGGVINPSEGFNYGVPHPPEPPAPPAIESPDPAEEEQDHDTNEESEESANYRDFVDLGVMELDEEPMEMAAPSLWESNIIHTYNDNIAIPASTLTSKILVLLPTPTGDFTRPSISSKVFSNSIPTISSDSSASPTSSTVGDGITTKTTTTTRTVIGTRTFTRTYASAFPIPMIEED